MSAEDQRPDQEQPLDGGAYIGNRAELAEETIPGGVSEEDERVAAYGSRSSGAGGESDRAEGRGDESPSGHRDGMEGDAG